MTCAGCRPLRPPSSSRPPVMTLLPRSPAFPSARVTGPTSAPERGRWWGCRSPTLCGATNRILGGSPISAPRTAASSSIAAFPGCGCWRQCMNIWDQDQRSSIAQLIEEAQRLPAPDHPLDLDDPALLPSGDMIARIGDQRRRRSLAPLPIGSEAASSMPTSFFIASRIAMALCCAKLKK